MSIVYLPTLHKFHLSHITDTNNYIFIDDLNVEIAKIR